MSNMLAAHSSGDPSYLGYPPTLPVEIALKDHSVQDICAIYGLTAVDWHALCQNPVFVNDLRHAIDELKKDGVKFKLKARLQAELMLKRIWDMAHEKYEVVPLRCRLIYLNLWCVRQVMMDRKIKLPVDKRTLSR